MRQQMSRFMGSLPMRTTESLLSIHSMLRDKMAFFVHRAPCSVGILLSRSFDSPKHILVYVRSASDLRLLPYARTMAENNQATLRIVLSTGVVRESLNSHPGEEIIATDKLCSVPTECDLVVVSYTYWQESFDSCEELLAQLPSTLILNLK
jgi:sodium/hydrogen antiporter